MDFVVAGFGVGAILMLLGFAVRDLGPLRYRSVSELLPIHDEWLAMCRSVGTVFVIGGLVVCLATLVSLLAGAGDRTGSRSVMAVVAMATIACGVWSVMAIRRFVAAHPTTPGVNFGGVEDGVPSFPARAYRRPGRGPNRQPFVPIENHDDVVAVDDEIDVADEIAGETPPDPSASTLSLSTTEIPKQQTWPESTTLAPERDKTVAVPVELPVVRFEEPAETTTVAPDGEGRVFSSLLLTDVEADADEAGPLPAQGFRSSLLADLPPGSDMVQEREGFTSSIFAGLEQSASESSHSEVNQGENTEITDEKDSPGADAELVKAEPENREATPRPTASGSEV